MSEARRILVPRASTLSPKAKTLVAIAGAVALILWGFAIVHAFSNGKRSFDQTSPEIQQGTQSGQASLNRFHSAIKTLRIWMTSKNQ